jgi:glycosyltransferase involved in cell wall biosynthesis
MNIQFVYFGKRGGGVNDLTSLLNSIDINEVKIYSLNNLIIKNKLENLTTDVIFDFLRLPNTFFEFLIYLIKFDWLSIFRILNKNKPEHIIITMFHPMNLFIFAYKVFYFKKIKIYYFLHNDNNIQTFNQYIDLLIRFFDILFCTLSNKILLLSENVKLYAKTHFLLKYKQMSVIGFGVYHNKSSIKHSINFYEKKSLTFIFFGKILPYKGIDFLIDALEILNSEKLNFHCYIVGEGLLNYQGASDNISIYNKWVEDDKLQEFINNSHFSIFPYRSCSQSGALSTAISNNIPVLVSNISVLSDYVNENDLGFVLSDLNALSIVNSIKELDKSRNALFKVHTNIIKYNENNNTWSDVWSKLYSSLIKS